MRYYKITDSQDRPVSIGVANSGGTQITAEEYTAILARIKKMIEYANKVYSGAMDIGQVPERWRAEVQEQVNKYKADVEVAAQRQIPAVEFMNMVEDVL